ncbi:MAG: hypothetical protein WBW85_04360 [Terriglobales bacterium]
MRVAVPDAPVAANVNSAPDELSPDLLPGWQPARASLLAGKLDRGIALRSSIKAGVLGIVIGIIPLLGVVLTGALAVFFYRRANGFVPRAALGSRLGGAAGVIVFAINSAMLTVRIFVFHGQKEYIDFLTQIARSAGLNAADPDIQAVFHTLLTPLGLAISLFFGMIITVALACMGGALASLFLRPNNPRR